MIDATGLRQFKGYGCVYRDLASREPRLFLRRNLNQILDTHERLLRGPTNAACYEVMVANERRAAGWDFPTVEMLRDLAKGDKPVLRLDKLQFRLLKPNGGEPAARRWQYSADEDGEMDWLPSLDDDLHLPCKISVTIKDSPNAAQRPKFTESRSAKLVKRTSSRDVQFIDAELDEPFHIELDSLFVEKQTGTVGQNQWKRTANAQYFVEVTVHCASSRDAAQFLSHLDRRESGYFSTLPSNECIVKAIWSDLPTCPGMNDLLSVSRITGHKRCDLKCGMAISMGWTRRQETPLERHNQVRHKKEPQQLPTPSSSDDAESAPDKQYVVRYNHQSAYNNRAQTMDGLACILCRSAAREGRADLYNSQSALKKPTDKVNRLLLHYMTFHSHYEWTLAGAPVETDDKVLLSISFESREQQARSGADNRSKEEHSWIAPNRPFDLSAYINGDHSWTGGSEIRRIGKGGRLRKPKEPEQANESSFDPPPKAELPADVVALPDLQRLRVSPPAVQNVTFYHSSSKHPIRPNELVCESEDDTHDDRLLHSQRQALQKEHGLTDGAREFHEAFNRHVDVEQSASQKLIWEGVVRFAREHQGRPCSVEWISEYESKLKLLLDHGIIGDEVVAYCLGEARPAEVKQVDNGANESKKGPPSDEDDADSPNAKSLSRRVKGKFAKRAADKDPESQQEPNGKSQRPRKPHRWSGGGADKDIIMQGRSELSHGAVSEPPAGPTRKRKLSEASPQARPETTTPPPENDSARRKTTKFVYEDGGFHRVDELGNPIFRSSAPNGGTPGTERRINRPKDGFEKHEEATMMIAHRPFTCVRLDDSKRASTEQGYVFLKDAKSGKSAELVEVEDLDFNKFQSFLKRALGFKQGEEDVVCNGVEDQRMAVLNESSWHASLNDSYAARSPTGISFAICSKGKYPAFGQIAEEKPVDDHVKRLGRMAPPPVMKSSSRKRVCFCGDPAEAARNCIACDNVHCARQNFHLRCVGLETRAVGWQCRECTVSVA